MILGIRDAGYHSNIKYNQFDVEQITSSFMVKTSKDYIRLVKKFGHVRKYPKIYFTKSNSRIHYSPKKAARIL
jgi:hypothetical protein